MKHVFPLIISILLLFAAIGGYWYMTFAISNAIGTIADAKGSIESTREREQMTRTASSFLAETAAERAELDTFIAQNADFVAVIESIEGAAAREKVSATVDSVNVSKTSQKYHEIVAVSVSARGSFGGVLSFASALETLPFASRVTSLSLDSTGGTGWYLQASMEFVKRKPTP